MKLPTVHRNGTSAKALLDGYCAAGAAIRRAMEAVQAAAPNGRDYYPQGPDALPTASREHSDRIRALEAVERDMRQLAEHVADEFDRESENER